MVLGILAVYLPPAVVTSDHILGGSDHAMLHARRMAYAREHLFSSDPQLPAWYTRELLGTPFWSNVQNFPFTPPRLLLLAFEPHAAYAVGVNLAAVLTGLFTYLYCRRIGLGALPGAAAGWTIACCGYFASRVLAGHLPLLEAFPSLPLLLWLVEVCRGRRRERDGGRALDVNRARTTPSRGSLVALGAAAACIALCGHPQLPVYALVVAFLYAVLHEPRRWRIAAAMVLGVGVAAFALLPMLGLIGRSTRVLGLDAPENDVVMPYGRLASFLFPWRDGWPRAVPRGVPHVPFMGERARDVIFWDTVTYVGWLPVLAAGGLLAWGVTRLVRQGKSPLPPRPWPFIVAMGVVSLLMALPPVQQLTSRLPGTFLRSPSRLLYLTSFALALGLAAGLEALLRWASACVAGAGSGGAAAPRARAYACAAYALAALALAAHAVDLASHSLDFIYTERLPAAFAQEPPGTPPGEGPRAAIDAHLWLPVNRRMDDVGFFDSVMLARPYRAVMAMAGRPPGYNRQVFNAPALSGPALHVLGVETILTSNPRGDLPRRSDPNDPTHHYKIPSPVPRAAFFGLGAVRVLDREAIQERFRRVGRDPGTAVKLRRTMALPPDAPGAAALSPAGAPEAREAPAASPSSVAYRRLSSDAIALDVNSTEPGYVRVLEAWDEGWSATVDGEPADVEPADDTFLAVRVPPGTHQVVLEYRTKYASAGIVLSLLSAALLGLLAATAKPKTA